MHQPRPILLNAYAARRCARRIHNDFDNTIAKVLWEPDPALQAIFEVGQQFEADVLAAVRAAHGDDMADLTHLDESDDYQMRIALTATAMDRGIGFIIGGQLPDDPSGHRAGKPDLLIRDRTGRDSSARARYWPVEIKAHMHAWPAKKLNAHAARLSAPLDTEQVPFSANPGQTSKDTFQLAHYVRMLQACDRFPEGDAWGAIIGKREIHPGEFSLVWHNLDRETVPTFSRSQGTKQRSIMERYDHEHGFRVKVAEVANRRRGAPDDPEAIVRPIGQAECKTCPHLDWCSTEGSELASWALAGSKLSVREWSALSRLGHNTTEEIATLKVDADLLANYLPEVSNLTPAEAERRLNDAVRRCALIVDDVELEVLGSQPLVPPTHDVEIDLDCEWDNQEFVYLWGARIRDSQGARYVHFSTFEPPVPHMAEMLATELVAWLRQQIREAEANSLTIGIYHWAPPEPDKLRSLLGPDAVDDLIADYFIDLLAWSRSNLFSVRGHGLKVIAPLTGFSWAKEDAGGLTSQDYVATARQGGPEAEQARRWLLSYNEDDVAAMAHVRDHIAAAATRRSSV